MYRIAFLLILTSYLMVSCRQESKPFHPESYTIDYRTKPLTIDGRIDDAAWDEASWSSGFVDIQGVHQDKPLFDTRVKMLWDRHYLYIAAFLEEPDLNASLLERDAIIYRDNDFEVFIDPDDDALNYYEYEVNAYGTVMDLFLDKPYNQGGRADLSWDLRNLQSAVGRQGTLNDPSDRDTSWSVELAIPWSAFTADEEIPPENGDIWRMNFSRVQWAYDTFAGKYVKLDTSEKNWVWSAMGEINMHIPSRWGYVTFNGQPEIADDEVPEYWIWSGYDAGKTDTAWDSTFRMLREAGITGLLLQSGPEGLQKVIPLATT
ncbi:MAG: carbohydrate-binding family 9-like protein, partial [bacterium]